MLRPHTARSAYGVKKYFETADYYSQGNETVGRWGGKLAAEWGLTGLVTKDAFEKLCDNLHPTTGEQLTPRMNEARRVGEDFVFSLPKDVGAFIMLQPPAERDALLALAGKRVEQVMGMIEADVETRVRTHGAFENRPGDGLAWAGYLHTTARPVDGFPADPHPHWHMFAFNVTRDPEENRLKAADFAHVYRDRPYYESVFYSMVAKDFAEAGLPIERRAGGKWGLAGLQPLGVKFSKRTNEIEEEAKRLEITDAARKAELGAKTRSKKDKEMTPEQLRKAWDAQLTDGERDALAAVYRKDAAGGPVVTPAEAVAFAIAHCTEQQSAVPERELKRVALLHGLGSVTPGQIAAELPRHGVITGEIDDRLMATTEGLQEEERFITGFAAGGRGTVLPVGIPAGLTRVLDDGKVLNDGQWDTVTGLLESENRVNLFEGPAGAGKSYSLQKFDEGMRMAGKSVTYLATTTDAVGMLAKDGFEVGTVARFLLDEKMQAAAMGGRVVVDETSMLGHKDAHRLFKLAEKLDLKLILVGDPMQHGSVPRGALMRVLKEYGGITPFRLTEIMRQEGPEYRAAAKLLSEGNTLEGFDALDRLGWVKEMASDDDRYRQVAGDYLKALKDKKSVLVVSPTHAEAGRVREEIRSGLRQIGKLGKEEREFTRLVAVGDVTEAMRGLATTYRPGDVIQFHQNAKGGFKKGDRLTVTDPAAVPLAEADKFSLYRPEKIALSTGDKIRFTGKVKTLDGEHTLANGVNKTIAGFTKAGDVKLDNGWVVSKDAGHFRQGFVETSFGSQGRTVQRVILAVAETSLPAANQEQMYVGASRAKQLMTLYTDHKAAVRSAVQRSSQKLAASDLLPKHRNAREEERNRRQRKKRHAYLELVRASYEVPHQPQPPQPPHQPERQVGYER